MNSMSNDASYPIRDLPFPFGEFPVIICLPSRQSMGNTSHPFHQWAKNLRCKWAKTFKALSFAFHVTIPFSCLTPLVHTRSKNLNHSKVKQGSWHSLISSFSAVKWAAYCFQCHFITYLHKLPLPSFGLYLSRIWSLVVASEWPSH